MKPVVLFLAFTLFGIIISANADVSDRPNDQEAALKFQQALAVNDYEAISLLIAYPLRMPAPLSNIIAPEEFIHHWSDFFDDTTIPRYLEAEPQEVGWRGIMLEHGCIWFNEGKIRSINCRTIEFDKRWQAAKELEWERLHTSARGYDNIQYSCHTDNLYIRIQNHGDDMRYFAWKKGASLTDEPELVLHNGFLDRQGTGGNHSLTFENSEYRYEIYVSRLCGEDCNDYITIYKEDEVISQKVCEMPRY